MNKLILLFAAMTMFSLTACRDPGPAEEAGRTIDEAVEEVADEIDDAF